MGILGNLFGGRDKRKQKDAMADMRELADEQVDYYTGQQQDAQDAVDESREVFDNFEFKNDFEDLQNPYADIQTEFDNVYENTENVYEGAENVYEDAVNVADGMTNVAADAQNVYAGAKNTFAGAKNTFAGMDNAYAGLENKYEGMENRFEDMTVDMKAADFQAQQGKTQRANIMQGLKGAAGSSGVAGLAQAMANQGQMQSQQIAAGIGQQERQNAMMSAQEGSRIDQLQRGAGMQLQSQEAGGAMANQQAERSGAMQQQSMQMQGAASQQAQILGGAAAQQAQQLAGAQTLQNQQIAGASEQQNLILGGRDKQQDKILAGRDKQQDQILAGQQTAVNQGISQTNIQAGGQGVVDMQIAQGNADVQAAEYGQLATGLGMDYGLLAGANQGLQNAMGNQMSGLGNEANMYGSNAANSIGGQFLQAGATVAAGALGAKSSFLCVPQGVNIDCENIKKPIEQIKVGDMVVGYNGDLVKVLQKHEYLEDPKVERFYKVKFLNTETNKTHEVDVCDMHRIMGERAMNITKNVVSKEIYSGVNYSYDLLTEDAGYRIDDIPVNSMIEELALATSKTNNK